MIAWPFKKEEGLVLVYVFLFPVFDALSSNVDDAKKRSNPLACVVFSGSRERGVEFKGGSCHG